MFMKNSTYLTSIQVEVYFHWKKYIKKSQQKKAHRHKIYYDLVELTPDQIKAIVKITGILSRGIYECKLPAPLEDQVTENLNVEKPN